MTLSETDVPNTEKSTCVFLDMCKVCFLWLVVWDFLQLGIGGKCPSKWLLLVGLLTGSGKNLGGHSLWPVSSTQEVLMLLYLFACAVKIP